MEYLSISEIPFVKALENDEVVSVKRSGVWTKHPHWFPRRIKSLLEEFTHLLDSIESVPLLLDKTYRFQVKVLSVQAKYLDSAIALESYALRHRFPKSHPSFHRFKLRVLALLYRLEELAPSELDLALYDTLLVKAQEWKKKEISFWHTNLEFHEENLLKKTCEHSKYVREVLRQPKTLNYFFKWVLRDRLPLEPLIEYPNMIEKLQKSLMIGRISRHGGKILKIKEVPVSPGSSTVEKMLTLPFEGTDTNILDPYKKFTFRGEYTLSVGEVLNSFAKKKTTPGNLELMKDGIINWNTNKLAYWDALEKCYVAIDLLCDEWWNQLPDFEIITAKQARAKYGAQLDGENWNFSIRASREDHSLNFENCHSYLEIAIPLDRDHYKIFDFGKFSTRFPKNDWEKLWIFSVFTPAVIAYPDENIFYTHRQHVNYSNIVTAVEGYAIMDLIKDDMLEARKGNLFFQIESENCGKWIHGVLSKALTEERVPNYFKLALFETEPKGVVKWIFDTLKKLPNRIGTRLLTYLHLILGGWRGVWYKSPEGKSSFKNLVATDFWNDTVVYLPAMLHHKYQKEHASQVIDVKIPVAPPKPWKKN